MKHNVATRDLVEIHRRFGGTCSIRLQDRRGVNCPNMETERSSATSTNLCQTTRRHIPQPSILPLKWFVIQPKQHSNQFWRIENLTFLIVWLLLGLLSRYSDLLRAERSGGDCQCEEIFRPFHICPKDHPASCKVGKLAGADHPPTSSAELANGFELYPAPSLFLRRHVMGWPLPLPILRSVDCCGRTVAYQTVSSVSCVQQCKLTSGRLSQLKRIRGKQVYVGVASAWAPLPCRLYPCFRVLRVRCWFFWQGRKNEKCPLSRSITGSR